MIKHDPKKLAAKYWDLLYPHINFYSLKEERMRRQIDAMEEFLKTLRDMEK